MLEGRWSFVDRRMRTLGLGPRHAHLTTSTSSSLDRERPQASCLTMISFTLTVDLILPEARARYSSSC